MNFSFFNKDVSQKEYLPDSIYTVCGDDQSCTICSNEVYSNVVNEKVHDTQRAKVFCPFGKGESMNQDIYNDQMFISNMNGPQSTTWGRAPQLQPRPLSKIGLEWRTN